MDLSKFPACLQPLTPKPGEWATVKYPQLPGGLEYHGWMSSEEIATFADLQPYNQGWQQIVMYRRGEGGTLSFPLASQLFGAERTRVGSARTPVRKAALAHHYEAAIAAAAELALRKLLGS